MVISLEEFYRKLRSTTRVFKQVFAISVQIATCVHVDISRIKKNI